MEDDLCRRHITDARGGKNKDDKRAIFTATSHAQKAADYLHGLQPQEAQS